MSAIDLTPFSANDLAAAYQGREGIGLRILRDAAGLLEECIRQRILSDAAALGMDVDAIAAKLDGSAPPDEPQKPAARAAKPRPEAPADDAALLKMLFAELDKGEALSVKALARRTGADSARCGKLLADARSTSFDYGLALNGLKWSRKAAP